MEKISKLTWMVLLLVLVTIVAFSVVFGLMLSHNYGSNPLV